MLEKSKIKAKHIQSYGQSEYLWIVDDVNGDGRMYCIKLWDGIEVIYNDFHCFDLPECTYTTDAYLEINHCRQGKFECPYDAHHLAYLDVGDFSVSSWSLDRGRARLPLGYYQGVEVLIDVAKASQLDIVDQFAIDINDLYRRLRLSHHLYIERANETICHLFSQMYDLPLGIRQHYLQIKVLELLLFLSQTAFEQVAENKVYYPKQVIEALERFRQEMIHDLSSRPDYDALAKKHSFSLSTVRRLFKEIYEMPLYQWYKHYRLTYSRLLLKTTDASIIEIAGKVGYTNPSKFAAAFQQETGLTPQQYRQLYAKMD